MTQHAEDLIPVPGGRGGSEGCADLGKTPSPLCRDWFDHAEAIECIAPTSPD